MTETTQPPTVAELAQWRAEVLDLNGPWDQGAIVIRLLDALEAAQLPPERLREELFKQGHIAITSRHGVAFSPTCKWCGGPWPCLTVQMAQTLERAQAVIEAARKNNGVCVWNQLDSDGEHFPHTCFRVQICVALADYDAGDAKGEAT